MLANLYVTISVRRSVQNVIQCIWLVDTTQWKLTYEERDKREEMVMGKRGNETMWKALKERHPGWVPLFFCLTFYQYFFIIHIFETMTVFEFLRHFGLILRHFDKFPTFLTLRQFWHFGHFRNLRHFLNFENFRHLSDCAHFSHLHATYGYRPYFNNLTWQYL